MTPITGRRAAVPLLPKEAKAYQDYQTTKQQLKTDNPNVMQDISYRLQQIDNLGIIREHKLRSGELTDTYKPNLLAKVSKLFGIEEPKVSNHTGKVRYVLLDKQSELLSHIRQQFTANANNQEFMANANLIPLIRRYMEFEQKLSQG